MNIQKKYLDNCIYMKAEENISQFHDLWNKSDAWNFSGSPKNDCSPVKSSTLLLKYTLCLAFHCSYPCSLYDQCPHANREFLLISTVEMIFQNKSALKHHKYFMDFKCSKSKPFWMVKLHKYWSKASREKKMTCSMTSFGRVEVLEKPTSRLGTWLSIMTLKDEEISKDIKNHRSHMRCV